MAIYSSPNYTKNYPVPTGHGLNHIDVLLDATVTCSASPATTDTINFGYVPANAVITGAILIASDMDTGGSPALTITVGDAGVASRLFSASTVGQAGTVSAESLTSVGLGYKFTAKTLIVGVAGTNAATGAAGTVQLIVMGYVSDPLTSG